MCLHLVHHSLLSPAGTTAGRVTHSDLVGGQPPVAPSALAMAGQLYVEGGMKKDYEVPRALETSEIAGIVEQFVQAAR
jgi:N-ethylmaleimide reductase